MFYVLVVIAWATGNVSFQEFQTEERCNVAAEAVTSNAANTFRADRFSAFCVRK